MKINVNTHVGVPSVVASVLYIKPDWRLAVALLLSLALALAQPVVFAQTVQPAPDNSVAASIAPYGAGVRQAILVASQYPETLAQLQKTVPKPRSRSEIWLAGSIRKNRDGSTN